MLCFETTQYSKTKYTIRNDKLAHFIFRSVDLSTQRLIIYQGKHKLIVWVTVQASTVPKPRHQSSTKLSGLQLCGWEIILTAPSFWDGAQAGSRRQFLLGMNCILKKIILFVGIMQAVNFGEVSVGKNESSRLPPSPPPGHVDVLQCPLRDELCHGPLEIGGKQRSSEPNGWVISHNEEKKRKTETETENGNVDQHL